MEIPKPTAEDMARDPLADYGESEQGNRSGLWEYCPEEFRQWVRRAVHAEARVKELNSFIADTIPFLREAWDVCFNGQKQKLLSAEERGMGTLIGTFQAIADGKPPRAPGWLTGKECAQRVEEATAWAYKTLGSPNELKPGIREWVNLGETCADGMVRLVERVKELEANGPSFNELVNRAARDLPEGWMIGMLVERHSGSVKVISPDGDEQTPENERIEDDFIEAIEIAAGKQGQ